MHKAHCIAERRASISCTREPRPATNALRFHDRALGKTALRFSRSCIAPHHERNRGHRACQYELLTRYLTVLRSHMPMDVQRSGTPSIRQLPKISQRRCGAAYRPEIRAGVVYPGLAVRRFEAEQCSGAVTEQQIN